MNIGVQIAKVKLNLKLIDFIFMKYLFMLHFFEFCLNSISIDIFFFVNIMLYIIYMIFFLIAI